MAVDTSSTLTSSSHTLTAGSNGMAPVSTRQHAYTNGSNLTHGDAVAAAAQLLASLQPEKQHTFLQPSESISDASLRTVKETLEEFAGQVGEEQQRRANVKSAAGGSRKRKRGDAEEVMKVRKVYLDGFETGQVWEQAKRIIGGVLKFSEKAVEELEERNEITQNGAGINGEDDDDELEDIAESDEEEDELNEEDMDGLEDEDEDEDAEDDLMDEDMQAALAGEADDYDEQDDEEDNDEDGPDGEYVEDPNGLNDGFFSIDEFNRQSQWFEDQDARGDPNTDHVSDEEEIDWAADPFAPSKNGDKATSKRKASEDDMPSDVEGEDSDDDDDDGPTFGNMDLNAPEGDSEDEAMEDAMEDDEDDDFNANEVYYKDFFAPPPRKYKGDRPRKAVKFQPKQPDEADVERAIADVRRDLFDDESDNDNSEDALSDVSVGDPKSRRSAHERRQAKLADEIRKLEAASVAKREWTVSGEAAAVDRPMNSLLEEDLDFEHVGKPVPVITPEVTEGIEDLIKRRILAQEFDEVLRRRPGTENVPANTRRGLQEVDDSKPEKGLAEVYEEEHVKNANPDSYVSKSDEKLQREEREIEAMWKDVSGKLDALSSWHYRPKPAAPAISVVPDVATITMEDAQPATAQGVADGGASNRLAPQEIYASGKTTAAPGEVVSRGGAPVAREEMTREDKARRRRQEKQRLRNAGGADAASKAPQSKKAKERRDTMAELKKGGVRVINRKGEITDVHGKKAKAVKAPSSGSYKL